MMEGFKAGWYVHYREEDCQGGYWEMTPDGPYSRADAMRIRDRMRQSSRFRNVRVMARMEVEVP